VIIHLVDSIIFSPNGLPLSLLTLSTGSFDVAFLSDLLTQTLFPDAAICTSCKAEDDNEETKPSTIGPSGPSEPSGET
jgi:hypothetical protein